MPLIAPQYKDGSIVNLMSSIERSFGRRPQYAPLRLLPRIKAKNVVLMVIDGMGYEFLKEHGKDTLLWKHCQGHMTSVFPSTTAAAVTTFTTGLAPQQHGITGWYMHLKEIGMACAVLPMRPRFGGKPLAGVGIDRSRIFDVPSIYSMRTHIVTGKHIARTTKPKAQPRVHAYSDLKGFFSMTAAAIKAPGRKFIYSYWDGLDALSHDHGNRHAVVRKHLRDIDRGVQKLIKTLGEDTVLIITADHGHMTTKRSRVIDLHDHPRLEAMLSVPLCGEPRAAYCYVHADMAREFERYVRTRLKDACTLVKSGDAIKQGWFGLGKQHPRLRSRVGDYILIMKDDYVIRQGAQGRATFDIGNHGGMSAQEMRVPLILFGR